MTARKPIALLGGSFNPPHVAHLMVAYWTLATQDVREVWLLPSYRHPFGKDLAPFDDRVAMCELAARALRGVAVCTAERELADDPLVPRGLGSRLFDGEGIAAKRFALFEKGVARHCYVDAYYGRKLGMPSSGYPLRRGGSSTAAATRFSSASTQS